MKVQAIVPLVDDRYDIEICPNRLAAYISLMTGTECEWEDLLSGSGHELYLDSDIVFDGSRSVYSMIIQNFDNHGIPCSEPMHVATLMQLKSAFYGCRHVDKNEVDAYDHEFDFWDNFKKHDVAFFSPDHGCVMIGIYKYALSDAKKACAAWYSKGYCPAMKAFMKNPADYIYDDFIDLFMADMEDSFALFHEKDWCKILKRVQGYFDLDSHSQYSTLVRIASHCGDAAFVARVMELVSGSPWAGTSDMALLSERIKALNPKTRISRTKNSWKTKLTNAPKPLSDNEIGQAVMDTLARDFPKVEGGGGLCAEDVVEGLKAAGLEDRFFEKKGWHRWKVTTSDYSVILEDTVPTVGVYFEHHLLGRCFEGIDYAKLNDFLSSLRERCDSIHEHLVGRNDDLRKIDVKIRDSSLLNRLYRSMKEGDEDTAALWEEMREQFSRWVMEQEWSVLTLEEIRSYFDRYLAAAKEMVGQERSCLDS